MPLTQEAITRFNAMLSHRRKKKVQGVADIPLRLLRHLKSEDFTSHGFAAVPMIDGSTMVRLQQQWYTAETQRTRAGYPADFIMPPPPALAA